MCHLNCFMLHIWQDNTLLLCSLELLQRLAYFRRSDEGCPLTKWLSYYVCMRPQQDKWTKTPRDSLSCWNTPSLTLGSDGQHVFSSPWQMLHECQVHNELGNVCADLSACAKKEKCNDGILLPGKLLASHDAVLNPSQTSFFFFKVTISRYSSSTSHQTAVC